MKDEKSLRYDEKIPIKSAEKFLEQWKKMESMLSLKSN